MKNLFNNYIFWLLLVIIGIVGVVVGIESSEIFNTIGASLGLITALYFTYKTKNKIKNLDVGDDANNLICTDK
jgi:hypothetical protein